MKTTQFKQGDTFMMTCQYLENGQPAALPSTIESQVRGDSDSLVVTLMVSRDDEAGGKYSAQADTTAWPLGMVYIDVKYTYSTGVISRTPTINLMMVKAVTHA